MRRWARSALPHDQEVLALADQRLGCPRWRHAIRAQQFHRIMRVRQVPRRPSRRPVRYPRRCCAWYPDRGMDVRAWGSRSRTPRSGWRARWRWRGGPTTRNRGRRSSSVQPRRGSRGVRPAQLRCGGLPPKYVDGLGRAARSADEPGCRRLAGAGSGDGYAMDGGHRHTDRRCRTAGGSARSRAAGVAADWRVAALACWSAWRSG
jgi:hypothetical protein